MLQVLDLVQEGDAFPFLCLILILWLVGSKMTEDTQAVRQWGWRLSAGAFVAYGLYVGLTGEPADAQDWVRILLRALLAAGLVLGVSWIVLSVVAFIGGGVVTAARTRIHALRTAHARHLQQCSLDRAQSQQTQQHADHQAEQTRQTAARGEAKRRSTDARANAALTFSLFVPKLQQRFTQQMFDQFVATYMRDDQDPDDVERRGAGLLRTLQEHVDAAEPPEEKQTLEDLARWFSQQKERIDLLPLDEKVKRLHIAELTSRYAELSSRLMEKLRP